MHEYRREDYPYLTDAEFYAARDEARKHDAEKAAQALVDQLGKFVNTMNDVQFDAFATALANEHPTLLGQIAKGVGLGIMRRATRDPHFRPFGISVEPGDPLCRVHEGRDHYVTLGVRGGQFAMPPHREHDGRLDCATVIGAEMLAWQSFT